MASTGEAVRSVDPSATRIRYHQLDSLRGIAALAVVLSHVACILPLGLAAVVEGGAQDGVLRWLYNTPLVAIWSGGNAVRLFFVLSGFVLALPFLADRGPRFGDFMLRRWVRLWPPYMGAIVFALAVRYSVGGLPVEGLSGWFEEVWRDPLTFDQAVTHASMLSMANSAQTTPVLWSLTVEMRVAVVFPLLVWVVRRWGWQTLAVSLAVAAWAGGRAATPGFYDEEGLMMTAICLPPFVLGILLARHRHTIAELAARHLQGWRVAAALTAAVGLYTLPMTVLTSLPPGGFWSLTASTLGSCSFVALAVGVPAFASALQVRPLLFLGRISYSLYLVHAVVLIGLVHLFAGQELWLVLPVGVAFSVLAGWALCRLVEEPAIRWARMAPQVLAELRSSRPADSLVGVEAH